MELHIIVLLAGTFLRLLVKTPEFQFCGSFDPFFKNLFSFQTEIQPGRNTQGDVAAHTQFWNASLSEISTTD